MWTEVFETLGLDAAHALVLIPALLRLAGAEEAGASLVRREAQLARFWSSMLSTLPEAPGARLSVPIDSVSVRQYIAEKAGLSIGFRHQRFGRSVERASSLRVMYPAMQRPIIHFPTSRLHRAACSGCLWMCRWWLGRCARAAAVFAPPDHVIYATAELTDMEYENGRSTALEFIAASPGEAILQLSHESAGPLIAAGRPSVFDWDPKTLRARLPIPAGNAKTGRVRVALAIDAPDATAFFLNPPVLLIGETNALTAEFAPPAVASTLPLANLHPASPFRRSSPRRRQLRKCRLKKKRRSPWWSLIKWPCPAAIPGDTAQLAMEADGAQLSHAQARLLPPAAFSFEDAVSVRVAAGSFCASGASDYSCESAIRPHEIVVTLHNNAPEIRTFDVEFSVAGPRFFAEEIVGQRRGVGGARCQLSSLQFFCRSRRV